MKTERVKNSVFNGIANVLLNMSVAVISFVLRMYFIKSLGKQCLGLDGLFTNILSFLSLAELGFSTSISFSLYKPLAEKNSKKIGQLMTYFKKIYQKITVLVFVVGLCIIPFLKLMAKGYTVSYNIYVIYILYLLNTALSYFISYITILIEADQKNYKLTGIRLSANIVVYGLQLVSLIVFKNFILYLGIQLVFRMIERIVIYYYVKKQYPDINLSSKEKLNITEKNKIKTNVKGVLFHKIGNYAVNGTDNILISSIINISATGVYYNYLSITSVISNTIGALINATGASFGNLNVTEDDKTKENVFDMINFVCLLFSGIAFVGVFTVINPFIKAWFGAEYMLNIYYVIIICINMYLSSILMPVNTVKDSSGLYYIDRYVPIIQAIINLGVSIFLGRKIGMIGILLGTCISGVLTVNWSKPYVIYKKVFNSSAFKYYFKVFKNIVSVFIAVIIMTIIKNNTSINNEWINIIILSLLSIIVYTIIYIIMNFNTKEFKYFIKLKK